MFVKVSPSDYARHRRSWRGSVPLRSFSRLATELASASDTVAVDLKFELDEHDRVHMCGTASVQAELTCHRCANTVPTTILAEIDAVIVRSDAVAERVAQEADVIVVTENPIQVCELVEDDLIMSIPWRVDEKEHECIALDASETTQALPTRATQFTQKPFENLRKLLEP